MLRILAIPAYAINDEQLVTIARILVETEEELLAENGPDKQAQDCVAAIVEELEKRGHMIRIEAGKIIW